MPLPKPNRRQMLHLRDIQLRGYEREDGLLDVEARMTDIRTYSQGSSDFLSAGTPVHDMWLRITVDRDLLIHDCEASMDSTPYATCSMVATNYRRLKGLTIGKGFIKAAMQLLGGVEGCTHLRELLQPVATVAYQTLSYYADPDTTPAKLASESGLLNTCHAYREDGPLIMKYRAQREGNTVD